MDKIDIIIPIISFGLSLLVGLYGKNRPIGFFMAFWVSLFFTPIIGIIVTIYSGICSKKKADKECAVNQWPCLPNHTKKCPNNLAYT